MATLNDLVRLHPELAHVTFEGGFEGIRQLGLWSVTKLEAISSLSPVESEALLATYRSEPKNVSLPGETRAVLRDQLRRRKTVGASLSGITEGEWLTLLNQRVFLFPAKHHRVKQLVFTHTSKGNIQEVIYLDTLRLLHPYADLIEVTTVNSGTFPRVKGPSRGPETFLPLAEVSLRDLEKVQEVTVKGWLPLPDHSVLRAVRYLPSGQSEDLCPLPEEMISGNTGFALS